jgi:helix-turn-helix protein
MNPLESIDDSGQIRPGWIKTEAAARYSSIGKTKIYELINQGILRTSTPFKKGNTPGTRGVRLISLKSLDEYLEAHAEGGHKQEKHPVQIPPVQMKRR